MSAPRLLLTAVVVLGGSWLGAGLYAHHRWTTGNTHNSTKEAT